MRRCNLGKRLIDRLPLRPTPSPAGRAAHAAPQARRKSRGWQHQWAKNAACGGGRHEIPNRAVDQRRAVLEDQCFDLVLWNGFVYSKEADCLDVDCVRAPGLVLRFACRKADGDPPALCLLVETMVEGPGQHGAVEIESIRLERIGAEVCLHVHPKELQLSETDRSRRNSSRRRVVCGLNWTPFRRATCRRFSGTAAQSLSKVSMPSLWATSSFS